MGLRSKMEGVSRCEKQIEVASHDALKEDDVDLTWSPALAEWLCCFLGPSTEVLPPELFPPEDFPLPPAIVYVFFRILERGKLGFSCADKKLDGNCFDGWMRDAMLLRKAAEGCVCDGGGCGWYRVER